MRPVDVSPGERFNRLVVIREIEKFVVPCGQKKRQFLFACDCGNTTRSILDLVRRGKMKSCGCLANENRTKHGLAAHPLSKIWYGMHDRCKNNAGYSGRGISVCPEWTGDNGLKSFVQWSHVNGYRPGLEIDREDNDGDYSPSNCRFVSRSINQRNKRDALKVSHPKTGEKISLLTLWENEGNPHLGWETVRHRYLYRGWSVKDSITKAARGSKQ